MLNSAGNSKNYKLVTENGGKGVLIEPSCSLSRSSCGFGDAGAFKGIFVRDLRTLVDIAPASKDKYESKYDTFFKTQAHAIEADDTAVVQYPFNPNTYHFFGMFWTGPKGPRNPVTTGTQASALEALVASLDLPKP